MAYRHSKTQHGSHKPPPRRLSSIRASRRGRLNVEPLEARWLPTLTVQFADAVAVVGSGSVDVESNAVANDSAGNVYVTGSLQGTANFSPGGTAVNLTSAGNRDVFFAKYGNTGGLLWAKDLHGGNTSSVAQGAAIAVDASGNVYLSGTFTGTTNFDPNAGNTSFTASGRNDVFIAKYDSDGNLLWSKDIVGTSGSIDEGYAISVDGSGNVVAAGSYQSSATFGSTTLTATGQFESFVTKLNSSGQFLWAKGTTGSGGSVAQAAGVTVDASGNVISTGFYSGVVNFNPGSGTTNLPQSPSRSIFIQKLDGNGNLVWAQGIVGTDINQANGVAADASGNLYVTGTFTGTVNFDVNGGTTNLTAGGYEDPFVLKLSGPGQIAWARDMALTGFSFGQGSGVSIDGQGNVFVAGYYQGVMTLDPNISGASITSAGNFDAFLAQYDPTGKYLASQTFGGPNFDADFGIDVNSSGAVAIAGRYTGPATFGPVTLPSQPNKSVFVASIASQTTVTAPPTPAAPVLETASDSGLSSSDGITNVQNPTFDVSATNVQYALLLMRDGTVVASRLGAGPLTDPGPVPNGVHSYTTIQKDAANNSSQPSTVTSITEDATIPSTPAVPSLFSGDDSGVKGDGVTNVSQPHISGKIDPLTLAQLFDGSGNFIASGMSGAAGSISIQVPAPLADGTYTYKVREESVAGNLSAVSTGLSITIVTHAATPPAPVLLAADDSGTQGDNITNVKQPRLLGTATGAASVQIVNGAGTVLGTASVTGGSYTVQFASPLSDGTYFISTRITDAAGNLSAASPAISLTIDTTPPAAPATPALLGTDDSGTLGDGITNVKQPHLTGSGTSGTTVQLLNAGGTVLGSTVVGVGGSYSIQVGSPLSDGTYVLHAQAIDAAGNVSTTSGTVSLTILTATPAAPSTPVLLTADDSGTQGDGITNVKLPHFTGTATAGTTVQLLNAGGTVLGSAVANGGGAYSVQVASPLGDGNYVLHAQAVDVAGNVSASSGTSALTIDTVAPASPGAPSLLSSDDTGTKGDGVTLVAQPHLIGVAPANTTVQIADANGVVLGSATSQANGSYSVQVANPLAPATYVLHAQTVDAAGNVSTASGTFTLTIQSNSNLPATPSVPSLLAADDSGTLGDGITNVKQPHLTGTATAGLTIQIVNAGGTVLGSAVANAGGAYSVLLTSPLADGTYPLQARAQDGTGNLSPASAAFSLTIDTASPAAPSTPVLNPLDDSGTKGDGITNVALPRLTGTSAAGLTIQLLNANGTLIGSTPTNADGTFSVQPSAALPGGLDALQVRAIDVAGNLGAASGTLTLNILTTPPASPSTPVLNPLDDSGTPGDGITNVNLPRLTGNTQAGLTIQLLDANGNVLGSTSTTTGTTYSVSPSTALPDGLDVLSVRAVDVAGNVSAATGTVSLTIQTTAPAAPSIPVLSPSDATGNPGANTTSVTQPHLTGTATAGTTVQLLNSFGTVIGSASIIAGGYTIVPTSPLPGGVSVLTVRAVDVAGNVSAASPALSLTILAALATPSAPTLLPADDSGVKGDSITNVTQPHFIGTATPGLTVQIYNSNFAVIGSSVVGSDGTYSVAPWNPLSSGPLTVWSRAVEPISGNASGYSATYTLTILTSVSTPSAPALNPADDNGIAGDGRTSIRDPRFIGTVAPGLTVNLLNASGTVLAQTTASNTGAYSLQTPANLNAGTAAYRVQAVDVAGNVSAASPGIALTIADTAAADFNGDGKSGLSVFRPATAQWLNTSLAGGSTQVTAYGMTGLNDVPVPGDYDNTGHSELAVYRNATAQWYINSPTGVRVVTFGWAGVDIPVPGDYDGVGYTEPAVYRPTTGQWFVLGPNGSHVVATWGAPNLLDIPVPGDYDGVGYTEPAVFRVSTAQWFVLGPNGGGHIVGLPGFGATNLIDVPAPGDYDGTGKTEVALYRPATAQWFVIGPNGPRLLATYGAVNFLDYPTTTSVASLKRLGKVPPGIRASSFSVAGPAFSAPNTLATVTPLTAVSPQINQTIQIADLAPSKKTTSSQAETLLRLALDSLYDDRLGQVR